MELFSTKLEPNERPTLIDFIDETRLRIREPLNLCYEVLVEEDSSDSAKASAISTLRATLEQWRIIERDFLDAQRTRTKGGI